MKLWRGRSLHLEVMEDRRLLAVAIVDTDQDVVDFNDGLTSLREAIFAANTISGPDTIEFAPALTAGGPATILLTQGQLVITDDLTINGPGAGLLTIDSSGSDPTPGEIHGDGIRAFSVDGGEGAEIAVTIDALAIAGGDLYKPDGGDGGGGIASRNADLTLSNSVLRNNSASAGGAVWIVGRGTISKSVVTGNFSDLGGGLLVSGEVAIVDAKFSDNWSGIGGALHVHPSGTALIRNSDFIDNHAQLVGGAIRNFGTLTIYDSTISGNSAGQEGGAISNAFQATIWFSTITDNSAEIGGGVVRWSQGGSTPRVHHSVVAGNTDGMGNPSDVSPSAFLSYSLVGDNTGSLLTEAPIGSPDANGNFIGGPTNGTIDPLLGPLVNNGGPVLPDGSRMLTHALLPGSPAINAGDPSFDPSDPDGDPLTDDAIPWDQRGEPWSRVAGGQIDMGAIESQPNPLPGDYNFNGTVDGADYGVWRDTAGATDDFRADGSGPTPGVPDGAVDEWDFLFWRENFGNTLDLGSGAGATAQTNEAAYAASAPLSDPRANPLPKGEGTERTATRSEVGLVQRVFSTRYSAHPTKLTRPRTDLRLASSTVRQDAILASWLASHATATNHAGTSKAPRIEALSIDKANHTDAATVDRVFDVLGCEELSALARR